MATPSISHQHQPPLAPHDVHLRSQQFKHSTTSHRQRPPPLRRTDDNIENTTEIERIKLLYDIYPTLAASRYRSRPTRKQSRPTTISKRANPTQSHRQTTTDRGFCISKLFTRLRGGNCNRRKNIYSHQTFRNAVWRIQ